MCVQAGYYGSSYYGSSTSAANSLAVCFEMVGALDAGLGGTAAAATGAAAVAAAVGATVVPPTASSGWGCGRSWARTMQCFGVSFGDLLPNCPFGHFLHASLPVSAEQTQISKAISDW